MEMTGDYRIEAPRETVWQALNDPEILKQCIPGCEELSKDGDSGFAAKVKAKVGPVSAKFAGKVTLSDLNPPESYTISGEGQGGAAGFAKGGAKVRLTEDGPATQLSYEVNAQVGGKLAQIGSRLIDGTAKKLAGQFFENFANAVGRPAPDPEPTAAEPAAAESAAEAEDGSGADGEDDGPADQPDEPSKPQATAADEAVAMPRHQPPPSTGGSGLRPGIWVTALIVAVGILVLVFAV